MPVLFQLSILRIVMIDLSYVQHEVDEAEDWYNWDACDGCAGKILLGLRGGYMFEFLFFLLEILW